MSFKNSFELILNIVTCHITLKSLPKLNNEVPNPKSSSFTSVLQVRMTKALMIKARGGPASITVHMAEGITEQLFRRYTPKYN